MIRLAESQCNRQMAKSEIFMTEKGEAMMLPPFFGRADKQ